MSAGIRRECQYKDSMMKSMMLTSEVIALRLPLLAGEAAMLPGTVLSSDRRESERMVSEKMAALRDGVVEASLEAVRLHVSGFAMMIGGDAFGLARLNESAPKRLAEAFTAPGHKTLADNARRLRKS